MNCNLNSKSATSLVEVMIGIAILVVVMYFLTQLIYQLSTLQFEIKSRISALLKCTEVAERIYACTGENGTLKTEFEPFGVEVTAEPLPGSDRLAKVTVKKEFAVYTDPSKSYNESISFIRYYGGE